MRNAVRVLLVAGGLAALAACGSSSELSAPEPGSMADRMCDTNETGSGIVRKGGKNYDEDCLDAYPWEAE